MSRRVKDLIAKELQARYAEVGSAVLVDPTGIDAITTNEIRRDLRGRSIRMQVIKNSLARRALAGGPLAPLAPLLVGPNALVTGGESIIDAAKAIVAWNKKIGLLKIRGGLLEGQVLDASGATALAAMPGRRELHQQVAGLALSPGRRLAAAILGPGGIVAGCIQALVDRQSEAQAA